MEQSWSFLEGCKKEVLGEALLLTREQNEISEMEGVEMEVEQHRSFLEGCELGQGHINNGICRSPPVTRTLRRRKFFLFYTVSTRVDMWY